MGLWGHSKVLLRAVVIIFAIGVIACSKTTTTTTTAASCSNRVSTIYSGAAERTYCSTNYVHATPVTITGTAKFESRPYQPENCADPNCGLANIAAPEPIRFAEVVAYDGAGNIVQCGTTTNTGTFSLQLPTSNSTHTIKVFSRAANSHANVSVLNCPEENLPYSIEATLQPTSNQSVGIITAEADNSGPVTGAAFNIFEQVVRANEFLSAQLGNCGADFTGCETFTVAPKVQIYWVKGFNPNEYFGSNSGLSFYLPGYKKLYILGGISGDIYASDTDHFDNTIILHEYGHFLEDVYTITDSPGGSHYANSIIDPRLAWSEGWGNFIQAAVRNHAYYLDSIGTPDATEPTADSYYAINIPIESVEAGCGVGSTAQGCDYPQFDYEGNFREYAVTRALWDIFDSAANPDSAADDTVSTELDVIWAAMTSDDNATSGFLNPVAAFRTMGLLHYTEINRTSGVHNWSTIRSAASIKQGDFTEYARYVDNIGGCGKVFLMNPYEDNVYSYPINTAQRGSFGRSHLVRNNDFLHYYHGGGPVTFTLKALTKDVSGGYATELEPDLDLYLYNESARYGNSTDIAGAAAHYWDNNPATEQTETITLSNLAAGDYLLNVKVFNGRYRIDTNGATNNCIGSGFRQICENDPAPAYNYMPSGDDIEFEIEVSNGVNPGVDLCPIALP